MDQNAKDFRSGHEASVLTKLVDLIERNADELTNHWLDKVRHDASLHNYRLLNEPSSTAVPTASSATSASGSPARRARRRSPGTTSPWGPRGARRALPSPK